jgi:hypothetical protein
MKFWIKEIIATFFFVVLMAEIYIALMILGG